VFIHAANVVMLRDERAQPLSAGWLDTRHTQSCGSFVERSMVAKNFVIGHSVTGAQAALMAVQVCYWLPALYWLLFAQLWLLHRLCLLAHMTHEAAHCSVGVWC
jgi:hypothetical protein